MLFENPFAKIELKNFLCNLVFIFVMTYVCRVFISSVTNINYDSDNSIADYIAYILFCILFFFWIRRKLNQNKIDLKSIFGKFFINYRLIIKLFMLTAFLLVFSLGIVTLTLSLLSLTLPLSMESWIKDIHSTESQIFPISFYSQLLRIFAYVVIAPLAEEFFFRGVLLHVWTARHRLDWSIIMSSLVFGIFHIHPITASILGVFYTLLYIKYRSLFVPIFAHVINNAVAIAIPLFFEQTINNLTNISTVSEIANLWKIGVLLTSLTAPFIIYISYKYWPSNKAVLPYFANMANKN